ncbi:MAG TPA: type II secretion system secretin GspD [Planctomycetota bacterium]|nr:type II secretion system secretin GspD [Planctomycetota bacterium]
MRNLHDVLLALVMLSALSGIAGYAATLDEPPALQNPPEPAQDEPDLQGEPEPQDEPAAPQDDPPAPPEGPSRPAAAVTSEGIVLNFKDVPLSVVLEYLSEAAGFVIVSDVAVQGRISVISFQPLKTDEVVGLLDSVLKEKGYMALRTGRTLKILPLTDAKKMNVPVRAGNDPSAIEPSDRFVTQVIPLRFVDAVRLKQEVATLIPAYADLSANASSNALILTDTEANVRRIVEIVRALDTHMGTVAEVKVFPLKFANATNAARLINEIFKEETASQQQPAGPFGGGRRFRTPDTEESSDATARSQKVAASADDRTNTVVVSAPAEILAVVEKVVNELDANPAVEQAVFLYRLKNAKAANLAQILNSLFSTQTGRSQTSTSGRGQTDQGGRSGFLSRVLEQASAAAGQASDLTGQVYVVADEDSNSLMVMAPSKGIEQVRGMIADLDRPVPQVLIKVLIAEVTRTNKTDLGAEFSVLNLRPSGRGPSIFSDFGVAAQSNGLIYRLVEEDVRAALRALEEVGRLDVLSRPYILGSDNQAAKITIGHKVPFIRNSRMTETGQTINTIEYEDIGIILNVTPHINPDGLVIMDVTPEISTLTGTTVPISETVSAPVFAKRSAQSRVAIHDGQTIVIGGLMEDRKTDSIRKIPLLGDIPLLGALFRRTIEETSKTELLIFLTPHVARDATELRGISETETLDSKVMPSAIVPGTFQTYMDSMQRRTDPIAGTEGAPKP